MFSRWSCDASGNGRRLTLNRRFAIIRSRKCQLPASNSGPKPWRAESDFLSQNGCGLHCLRGRRAVSYKFIQAIGSREGIYQNAGLGQTKLAGDSLRVLIQDRLVADE